MPASMWSTASARTPWRLLIICILCLSKGLCSTSPCSQEQMSELTSFLKEKFLNIDQRLSQIEHNFEAKAEIRKKDISECISNSTGCERARINTDGTCGCFCQEGYQLNTDGKTCQDIDECVTNRHNCEKFCTNTNGSFYCSCQQGYILNSDNKTCQVKCEKAEHYIVARSSGGQLFKLFISSYNWEEGAAKCQAEGLQLAKAKDDDAEWIRRYIHHCFGAGGVWIGGRGDGTFMKWTRDQEILYSIISIEFPGNASTTSTDRCLGLIVDPSMNYDNSVNTPYAAWKCSETFRVLCEYI